MTRVTDVPGELDGPRARSGRGYVVAFGAACVVAALSAGGLAYLTMFYETRHPSGQYCGDLWGGIEMGGCPSTDAAWRTAGVLAVLLMASLAAVLLLLALRLRRARSRT